MYRGIFSTCLNPIVYIYKGCGHCTHYKGLNALRSDVLSYRRIITHSSCLFSYLVTAEIRKSLTL